MESGVSSAASRPAGPAAVGRPLPPVSDGPLSEDDFRLLRQVLAARRPAHRAARTARGSAITILLIGLLGVPLVALSPSWVGGLVVAGVTAIGVSEYRGAARMREGSPAAARWLGMNQLAFMALIVVYCLYRMWCFSNAPVSGELLLAQVRAQLAQVPEVGHDLESQLRRWLPLLTYGFYLLVITLSVIVQGSLALYYFSRRRYLLMLARATPLWVQRLLAELNL